MAELCADENFPLPTVRALRDLGHDVIALVVIGYVALHLGEAALLREVFTLPGVVLVALSVVVLTLRPYRSQI